MTTNDKPSNLKSIEPIAPPPEEEAAAEQGERADRIGLNAAAALGSTPAVGVTAERSDRVERETEAS